MTIEGHLEFSVLSAPLAAVDRRSLSQAWYSALYGDGRRQQPPSNNSKPAQAARAEHAGELRRRVPIPAVRPVLCVRSSVVEKPAARIVPVDRRAPSTILARRIERAIRFAPRRPSQASFSIEGSGGRVQLLFRTDGTRLKIIAICPARSRDYVASALAQARFALASRGIAVDATVQRTAEC